MVGRTHEARLDVTHWIHRILATQDTSREGPFQWCHRIRVALLTAGFGDVSRETGVAGDLAAVAGEDVETLREVHRARHVVGEAARGLRHTAFKYISRHTVVSDVTFDIWNSLVSRCTGPFLLPSHIDPIRKIAGRHGVRHGTL